MSSSYALLLALHSLVRWLVLASLAGAVLLWIRGCRSRRPFTARDEGVLRLALGILHLQFLLGLGLYGVSPIVRHFLQEFPASVKIRDIRFFGMEHITMMTIAVVVATIASARSGRRASDHARFRTLAIGFGAALLLILLSIPWPFSPFTARPALRGWG